MKPAKQVISLGDDSQEESNNQNSGSKQNHGEGNKSKYNSRKIIELE